MSEVVLYEWLKLICARLDQVQHEMERLRDDVVITQQVASEVRSAVKFDYSALHKLLGIEEEE